jgi:hypothetical protein
VSHSPSARRERVNFWLLVVGSQTVSQPHFGQVWGCSPTLPKLGIWSPPGLPNVYSSIARPKTPCIEVFLVSLERYWIVDNENGLALAIWTYLTQVMGKRRAGSQIANLTPDHKKSGIDLFPTSELRLQYVVEKISTRATSLVQTLLRSDFAIGSYELPKSRDSNRDSFGTISGLGSHAKKSHLDVVPEMWRREYDMGEGGGFPRVQAMVCLVVQSARGLSQHPRVFSNVN